MLSCRAKHLYCQTEACMCQKKHGVGVRGDTIYYSESCLVSEEKCVHIVVDNNFQEVTFEVCFVSNFL